MISDGIVYVIEDDLYWQDTLLRLLRSEGYNVKGLFDYHVALNGILQMEENNSIAKKTSLCVVDLCLRGNKVDENFDGFVLLAACKIKRIPTIVNSGFLTPKINKRLRQQFGVLDCFDKGTFQEEIFITTVRQVLSVFANDKDKGVDFNYHLLNIEFQTKVEAITDTVANYYKKAHSFLAQIQNERREARGKSMPEDEAIYQRQINELDERYSLAIQKLGQANTISELENLHFEIIKECIQWLSIPTKS
jgi:hypothetical protein